MMSYFIQVIAFQLLFLVSYDLFLKKETFFNWNRAYLICSSLIAFLLPFIKFESFQNAIPQEYIVLLPEIVLIPEKTLGTITESWNWYFIIGISISSVLLIYKIVQLLKIRFKGNFIKRENYSIIIIPKSTMAFSIFRYVFIGDDIHETKLEDILSHELVHIREKHSFDLLYFELLRILFWFNPLVYIYQKRISELHEYIADAAIVQHKNKSDYYEKLLAEVFQVQHFSFTNQFFKHSLIKKRIIMLTKQKSREILKLKYLVLVPVLLLSLLYTSCEETTVVDTEEKIETLGVDAKNELLQELMQEFKEFNERNKGVAILPEEEYEEQVLLMTRMSKLLAKGDSEIIPSLSQANSYEDYVAARKKGIAEVSDFSELETQSIEFKMIDKAPVFPGCDEGQTLEALKDCFSQSLAKHVNLNFNIKLAEALNLEGVQRMYAKFIVDKNGEIKDVNVRAPHPDLTSEVERVLGTLPRLIPAEKDGKAVSLKYVLPIAFKIQ